MASGASCIGVTSVGEWVLCGERRKLTQSERDFHGRTSD